MVKRKATTSSTSRKFTPEEFEVKKAGFLAQIKGMVGVHKIPTDLIINWDQTGIHLAPAGQWTPEQRGAKRVEISASADKCQITATFAATMSGVLPMQLLYEGKRDRCHPKFNFPESFDVFHTPNHWPNTKTCVRYVNNIIIPYVQHRRESLGVQMDRPALVIFDAFSGQMKDEVSEALEMKRIMIVHVPGKCRDRLTITSFCE